MRVAAALLRPAPLLAIALIAAAAGCTGTSTDGTAGGKPRVVVTTTILGDLTRELIGDLGDVEVLIPAGTDPHEFEASAQQIAHVHNANLVVANGLGLEQSLSRSLDDARNEGVHVLEVGPHLNPIAIGGSEAGARGPVATSSASATVSNPDPHVWMDPDRMARATHLIADALAAAGLDNTSVQARAQELATRIAKADEEVQSTLATIPDDRRLLVTNHDSMGYFADRYGFRIVGAVIPGGSTLAEPSAQDLASLTQTIKSLRVPAIFAETTQPTRLADTLARETGSDVRVVVLYTESLGPAGSGADHYTGMITTNAHLIADALSGGSR